MASVRSGHATWYLDISLVSQNVGANTSVVNVHFYAIADAGWSGNASGIGFSLTGFGNGTFGFNGGSIEIMSFNMTVPHNADGYYTGTWGAHANATGTTSFGGPVDLAQTYSPPRIPKPPDAPGLVVSPPVGSSVTVKLTIPAGYDDGGTTVTTVSTQWSKDGGAFTGTHSGGWNTPFTYTNLAPGSYVFRGYATNARGNSPFTVAAAVKVTGGLGKIKVAGAWKNTALKIKVAGVMKDMRSRIRVSGAWKDTL